MRVRQGVGDLTIVLPDGVPVDVDTDVNAGDIRLPRGTAERHVGPPEVRRPARRDAPVITIDAELGVGSLEVRRATP